MICAHAGSCATPILSGISAAAAEEKRQKWSAQAKEVNPEAQYHVAETYCSDRGAIYDTDLAIAWYCRAAVQGYTAAQYKLANI